MDFEKCILILKQAIEMLNFNMYHLQGEKNAKSVLDLLTQIDNEIGKTPKPKTNYDKITESAESLAEAMVYEVWDNYYKRDFYRFLNEKVCDTREEAIQIGIEWLQKECD